MKQIPVPLTALLAATMLAGCDSNDDFTPAPLPVVNADVRFLHASPDAPNVNIEGSASTIASDVEYKESTALLPLPVGVLNVSVDGIVPGGTATVIGPVDLDLAADTTYSVIAVGPVAAIDALVVTAPEAAVPAGSVRAQVVHAAPDAPAVDVFVTAPEAMLDQEAPLGSFAFGEDLGPVEVPAGDYRIRVTGAGDPTAVVFDSGTVPLADGADLLIVAVENTGPGDAPISLVVADANGSSEIMDADTPAELRAIHASPDAPNVDVVVNDDFDNPVLTDLPFTAVSPYLAVPPGTYNLKVTPTGSPGVIVIDADVSVEAGTSYSVYASDVLASIAPYVLTDDNRALATEAKVRIVHMAPGAGLVDIYVTEAGADIANLSPTFADVDFKDETGYVSLAGGEYDVTVTPAGMKDAAIGPATVALNDGGVYSAAARDATGGGPPFGLILFDDFAP